ncbi:PKD domain-containing protein [Pedobacter psychrodurus]|uniref:PKD domain-containing protein n=1 Tax=Pedobacter psychrodurus TaxID=2530456 RepID=A0A4R0PYZ7_9SPHI|nr:PKD domain-containing protein [Pedobacter psychrodurus]TCD28360.1 PKD domain-containing protein [Pedobacter psychrodurus]
MKIFKIIPVFAVVSTLLFSCSKTEDVVDAAYLPQQVYLPAANPSNAPTGVYFVNSVAVPGQTFRYTIDLPTSKFNIPLSVYRSGVDRKGVVTANLSINADTVAKLLLVPGKFPVGTEALPTDKYTLTPTVNIADGADIALFYLGVDLNYLRANLTKKFAIAVKVSSTQVSTSNLSHAVILIDPAFLVPTANFTAVANAKVASFSNTSLNAVTYSWDYGDGTTVSTAKEAPHTYATAGTYVVKLTAFGPLGEVNKAVKTLSVVIN